MKFSLTTDLTEGEIFDKLIEIAGAGFDSVELNISDLELSLQQNQNIKKLCEDINLAICLLKCWL